MKSRAVSVHCYMYVVFANIHDYNKCKLTNSRPNWVNLLPDQINMAMFFWYPVKSDLFTVRCSTRVHRTSHFLQGTRPTRPCLSGDPVG